MFFSLPQYFVHGCRLAPSTTSIRIWPTVLENIYILAIKVRIFRPRISVSQFHFLGNFSNPSRSYLAKHIKFSSFLEDNCKEFALLLSYPNDE